MLHARTTNPFPQAKIRSGIHQTYRCCYFCFGIVLRVFEALLERIKRLRPVGYYFHNYYYQHQFTMNLVVFILSTKIKSKATISLTRFHFALDLFHYSCATKTETIQNALLIQEATVLFSIIIHEQPPPSTVTARFH